jgi:uncharacterized protein (DUF1499 family)
MAPLPDPLQPLRHAPQPLGWLERCLNGLLCLVLSLGGLLLPPAPPAAASLLHLEGPVPVDLGVQAQGLAPCRLPAHCAMAEWPVADPKEALEGLLPAVLALDGVDVVETNERYLHATITSRLFGFVDDLELFADRAHGQIQARSQSRLGDSDLGVNARRLDRLHRALLATSRPLAAPQP